jgi:hypothetical protein
MANDIKLLMISAMYENGGNTTHRFLDGHPRMLVYPFESQLGTRLVQDPLTSLFPVKYRWPQFQLGASPIDDYRAFIDEECRIRARTPHVSKFRHVDFDFSDDERGEYYARYVKSTGQTRGDNVAAFFRSTFDAWKDYNRSGHEDWYVGYSPIVVVDAEMILTDLPNAHVLHVVRNPWSAYADTKRRAVPMSLASYVFAWTVNQYFALTLKKRFPDRLHIIRTEDVMANSRATLAAFLDELGVDDSPSLDLPSWNGKPLDEVYPWGTIRTATTAANRATALELSDDERAEVRLRAEPYLASFGYDSFL